MNDRSTRIKRIFNWGVENELVSESVAGLIPGETVARETDPIKAVPDWIVDATLQLCPPTVDDMVRFHRLTGCRPSEVCNLRWSDVDRFALCRDFCFRNDSRFHLCFDVGLFSCFWTWFSPFCNELRPVVADLLTTCGRRLGYLAGTPALFR